MTAKTVNYTPEMTAAMVKAYTANPTKETVEALASTMSRSVRSVVAKLSREGCYKKAERLTKAGEPVTKKNELADKLAVLVGLTEPEATSLEKVNKTALVKLIKLIE
jgi:hypothetical protein